MSLFVRFALLCVGVLLVLAPGAFAVPPDPPYEFNTTLVNPTGSEVTVYDHGTQACQPDDIPDIGARAIKDSLGRTQLIVSHYNTRREIGTTLDNVTHNCNVVLFSDSDPDPGDYNYQEWLHSIYTPDGQNVFAFVHNEYHGWDFYEECAALIGTPDIQKCWYNGVTLAKSTNAGDTFTQATSPGHLIASVPYQFAPLQGPYGIYRPSNIHLRPDGYFYMLVIAEPQGAQKMGICAMRTKNLASPTSWRAWDGQAYSVRFINPYVETSEDPADHVCEPVSSANSGPLRGFELNSLTYNTYYDKWMAVGQTVKSNIPGFYFATSDDLIHWSEPIRLMEGELPHVSHVCGDPDPVRDGAVLDPASPGRNFEYADQTVNLYFTRFNYFYPGGGSCSMTLDRDLIKYPIQFSGTPPTAAVTLQDLAGGSPINLNDAIQLDGTGSTDDGSIVQYDWDMDGDGTFEIVNGGSVRVTGFDKVRSGEAALRVHDNQGLQDEVRIKFDVDARIDFKPSYAQTYSQYVADTGAAYSDTRGYGWVRQDSLPNPTHTPLDLSTNTTDRDPLGNDTTERRLDTTLFMQYPTAGSNPRLVKTPGAFEIAVPCGVYAVTASVGDSAWSSFKRKAGDVSTHRINVEGQTLIDNFTPTDNNKFSSATRTVNVCDGRLTLDAIGGTNTKLNYVDVERVVASVDFQPELAETDTDYAKDTGAGYSDSRGYGWVREDSLANPTHTPLDLSANTADRDPYDTDQYLQKLDTTLFMQYPAAGSNPRLVKTPGAFEIALPCDDYAVTVSVGDSAWSSFKKKPGEVSTHRINVEGVNAIAGFVPTDSNKFATATRTVNVCDGRLTIDAIGGTNTKLNFIEIVRQ